MKILAGKDFKSAVDRLSAYTSVFGTTPQNMIIKAEKDELTIEVSGQHAYGRIHIPAGVSVPGTVLTSSAYFGRLPGSDKYDISLDNSKLRIEANSYEFFCEASTDLKKFERLNVAPPVIKFSPENSKMLSNYIKSATPFTKAADSRSMGSTSAVRMAFDNDSKTIGFQALTGHEAIIMDLKLSEIQDFPNTVLYVPAKSLDRMISCKVFDAPDGIQFGVSNPTDETYGVLTVYTPDIVVSYNTISGSDFPVKQMTTLSDRINEDFKQQSMNITLDIKALINRLKILGGFVAGYPELYLYNNNGLLRMEAKNLTENAFIDIPESEARIEVLTDKVGLPFRNVVLTFEILKDLGLENLRVMDKENNVYIITENPRVLVFIVKVKNY